METPVDETLVTLNAALAEKGWPPLGQSFDLHGALPPDVPWQPGVYVFLLDDGTLLRYPKGESAIFYAGETTNLKVRLGKHVRHVRECKTDPDGHVFYRQYEWAVAAGGRCFYTEAPEHDHDTEAMETRLLRAFESAHYSVPHANGQRGKGHYEPLLVPAQPEH
jgi:hypothetical protein